MKNSIFKFLFLFLFLIPNSDGFSQEENYDSVTERLEELNAPKSLGDTVLDKYKIETEDSLQGYRQNKEFAYMKYLDSFLRNTKDLKVDTAGNGAGYQKKEATGNKTNRIPVFNLYDSPAVKILLWIIAVVMIGFLIYKLFLSENILKRKLRYKETEPKEKNENESDPAYYDPLISQAVLNKDYRLAIRYYYLKTLYKLSDVGLIQFAADKTNYEYVKELAGNPYQNDFAGITLNYEYVWYGKFEITEQVYNRLATGYTLFHEKLKN